MIFSPETFKPYTVSQITHEFNSIFGIKISTDIFRHIFITSEASKTPPNIIDMENLAN